MPRLLLVRHGLTEYNTERRFLGHANVALNEAGRRQARRLRDHLLTEKIDAAYSSDLLRAMETAEIVLEGRGVDITPCAELRECDYGACEGLTFAEISERYPEVARRCVSFTMELEFPGGEAFTDFYSRTGQFLQRLEAHASDDTLLVSSHNGPIKFLLCHLLGISADHWWQLRVDNGSLSIVDLARRGAVLTRLNDVSHLQSG